MGQLSCCSVLFEYENGLRVLIGHPSPPPGFVPVPEVKVETRAVYADFTQVRERSISGRQRGGGGPIPFGADEAGKPLEVVHIRFTAPKNSDPDGIADRAENQMLVYVHELFHCFQRTKLPRKLYGNLRYNPDTTYAVYSEIEGLALQRAFGAGNDTDRVREYLADFVASRKKKRAESMSEQQANQERWEEFNEGGATYAEMRTLELLKSGGFEPALTGDAEYTGFRDPGSLTSEFADRMAKAVGDSSHARSRVYYYGAYQALLLDRLFPGWQRDVEFFDQEVERRTTPSAEARLKTEYPAAEIASRHGAELGARDSAYRLIRSRSGRVYVIDFKHVNQYVTAVAKPPKIYQLGLMSLWPEGSGTVSFDEVEVTGLSVPSISEQLYHIRAVDDAAAKRDKALSIEGLAQSDGTYQRAVVRTPLFTLKAPHVRVFQTPDLVKIQVLARVCGRLCSSQ